MDLPSTSIYPQAILFATLSLLTTLLNIPPLIWHISKRNHAFIVLIAWIILLNFLSFLNAVLWPSQASVFGYPPDPSTYANGNNDGNGNELAKALEQFKIGQGTYDGTGLCDIQAKLTISSYTALPSTLLIVLRNLSGVLNTDRINLSPTRAQKLRKLALEAAVIWTIPLLSMLFHYIVQPSRFFLFTVSGCNPSAYPSVLALVLIYLPPLLLGLIAGFYATLLLWRIYKYRRDMAGLLANANTSKSRFLRPVILGCLCIAALIPLSGYMLAQNLKFGLLPFRWGEVHSQWEIMRVDLSTVLPDRWVRVGAGLLIFLFFGLGEDARALYKSWMSRLGVMRWVDRLRCRTRTRIASTGSSIVGTGSTSGREWFKMHKTSNSTIADLPTTSTTTTSTILTGTTPVTKSSNFSKGNHKMRDSLASSGLEPLSPRSTISSASTFATTMLERFLRISGDFAKSSGNKDASRDVHTGGHGMGV
ncbi:MAG: hypothetical protein Q9159_001985 [Coniocarpon cinnabarinum]